MRGQPCRAGSPSAVSPGQCLCRAGQEGATVETDRLKAERPAGREILRLKQRWGEKELEKEKMGLGWGAHPEGWREAETERALARRGVPRWVQRKAPEAYLAHTGVLDIHPHGIGHHLPLAIVVNEGVISHQAEGRNEVLSDGQGQHVHVLAGLPRLTLHLQQLPFVHDLGETGWRKEESARSEGGWPWTGGAAEVRRRVWGS